MKLTITLFSLLVLINQPRKLSGRYEINYDPQFTNNSFKDYVLDFDENSFIKKMGNDYYSKGSFKIGRITALRKILILDISSLKISDDTTSIGFENSGYITFEIFEKNQDTLLFREAKSKNPSKIISKGMFIKIK